jgi:propanol-preferring alcohol dehydrogenase
MAAEGAAMRALRLTAQGAPLEAVDLPDPDPAAGEAVVRVHAAGICSSDAHYRAGSPKLPPLPRTLGHEIAGVVEAVGPRAAGALPVGSRVAVHYQVSCGRCRRCRAGAEQFCLEGAMIGNHRDGGYAERVLVPVRNLVSVPDEVALPHAAVAMCSSATAYHALVRARLAPGQKVAVFGLGGLGMSAVQLARAFGATEVFGVDVDPAKVALAGQLGAVGVLGTDDPAGAVVEATGGVDVAVELVGKPETVRSAIDSLGPGGRVAVVGLAAEPTLIHSYTDLIGREAEVVGVMDHLAAELPIVLRLVVEGTLDLDAVVADTVPLVAGPVNAVLDRLDAGAAAVRTVIVPSDVVLSRVPVSRAETPLP